MSEASTKAEAARSADAGFHDGELAVQQRAGVLQEAARLAPMLEPVKLGGGIAAFLADRTFAVITARDAGGRLWTSPLSGPPGFLAVADASTLAIHVRLPAGDPLHGLPAGQQAGLVIVEFAASRRVRINGTLTAADDDVLAIEVEQGYGNCPQYISQRLLAPVGPGQDSPGQDSPGQDSPGQDSPGQDSPGQDDTAHDDPGDVRRAAVLSPADVALIRAADTFFLGTTNPERGSDASHRGGRPGFVRVDGDQIWWPDYPGNKLFNSFGNLAVNPEAALLFPDFAAGRALYLSGTAEVEWGADSQPGDDGRTGRRAVFTLERLVAGTLLSSRQVGGYRPYRLSPPLTD
jgi:predicted pyridoxine 5'-phosphate oxidase superfamily flavin-nucleotide-binding protein